MFGTRPLLWLLLLASLIGGVHWYRYERAVQHDAGALAMPEPVLATGSTLPPWTDGTGFRYRPLGRLTGRVVVVSRTNYSLGEFAHLAPTDLAIAWGSLSDPAAYSQLTFEQRGSPLSGRYVFPDIKRGTTLARMPHRDVEAWLLANLTHVHAIPSDRHIASRLSGIRPGQVVELSGLLVEVTAPSGARYTSSLALHDYDCEIAWIDGLDLVN